MLVLKGLVGLHRTVQLQLLQHYWFGHQIRSDESLSRVRLFATPRIAAHQASLSIINSRSSLRLMSIESVDLDYCDIEWFALEMNRDNFVVFEIASKY